MTSSALLTGWAHTQFGRLDAPDVQALVAEVALPAIEDAGLTPADIDAISIGVFNNGFSRQGFEGALVGVAVPELAHVSSQHLENACATGSAALFTALEKVEAGRARAVLVIGAEKMTATPNEDLNGILLSGCHRATEDSVGSFAGVFAQLADAYADRYGDPHEAMARVAVKNHGNGTRNPWAHMGRDFSLEFCSEESAKNPRVSGRLLRTDCSMVSDGAAAVVVTNAELAAPARRAVTFRGRGQANDHLPVARRRDPVALEGAARAFSAALAESGSELEDLDLLETHDCFTIAEVLQYEAFGIAEPGRAGKVLAAGETERDGRLPVNVSGGLKAKGHPLGATGVSQHVMAAMQLVGEAGDMQLPRVDRAAVFNMGGSGVSNYASVLERAR